MPKARGVSSRPMIDQLDFIETLMIAYPAQSAVSIRVEAAKIPLSIPTSV